MLKNVVVLPVVSILLFCSCKKGEQADLGAAGGKKWKSKL